MDLIQDFAQQVPKLMLIFARLSAMVMTLPWLSYPIIPIRARVLIAFVLSIMVLPLLPDPELASLTLLSLSLMISKEILFGALIGTGARIIFESFSMAGQFIARQVGMALANVMDPSSRQHMPIYSQFWFLLMVVLFLVTNGHYLLIETLYRNFNLLPLGYGHLTAAAGESFVRTMSQAFLFSIKLGLPAMIFLLVLDTAFAMIARVMPQMNIFFVTLPLKVTIGFFVMIISIDIFQVLFEGVIQEMYTYLGTMTGHLGGV